MADQTVNVSAPGSPSAWSELGFGDSSWAEISGVASQYGSATAAGVISIGWGGDTWGENYWGELATSVIHPTGSTLTSSIGDLAYSGSEEGWGSRAYGRGSWGIAGTVMAQSQSLSLSLGSITAEGIVTQGWGGDTWSENYWGELITNVVVLTGIQLSSSVGELAYAQSSEGWGRLTWGSDSWGISGDVLATGMGLTTGLGTITTTEEINVGWGRNTYGNGAWGDHYSVAAQGLQITSAIGTSIARADYVAIQTGMQLNWSPIGTFGIQIDNNQSVIAGPEHLLDAQLGTFTLEQNTIEQPTAPAALQTSIGNAVGGLKTPVDVTGIPAAMGLGSITLIQSTVEPAGSFNLPLTLGNLGPIPDLAFSVTGSQLTSAIGEEGPICGDGLVILTGVGLTSSIGTPIITSWQEIDPDVTNVWTEVDIAA